MPARPAKAERSSRRRAPATVAAPAIDGLEALWADGATGSALYRGEHLRLLEGLPAASVDCVWTDPPYFLSNGGSTCQNGRRTKVDKGDWDQSRGVLADHQFNLAWLGACRRVLKPTGTLWVSGTHHVYLSVGMAMLELGYRLLNDIVWEKPNPPPNLGCRCFTHATEMLLWAANAARGSGTRHTFNYADMKAENDGRQMKNVWRFTAPGADEKRHGRHPTQKPLALIERCLRASTARGDVVLDPFAGSGSTGVAALALGRRFVGTDIDPQHSALAARRLAAAQADAHEVAES